MKLEPSKPRLETFVGDESAKELINRSLTALIMRAPNHEVEISGDALTNTGGHEVIISINEDGIKLEAIARH